MSDPDIDLVEEAQFCRDQALKARRLAGSVSDDRVIAALLKFASDMERRAAELEAQGPMVSK